jgi:prophage regulatory protein
MTSPETNEQTKTRKRLLKIAEVVSLVGVSRATVYRLIDSGEFPKPVQLSARRVAWVSAEVEDWMRKLEEAPRV